MNQENYKEIAKIIKSKIWGESDKPILREVAIDLADYFERQTGMNYPERVQFLKDCGVE